MGGPRRLPREWQGFFDPVWNRVKPERHFSDLQRDKSKYDEGLKTCKNAAAVRKLDPMGKSTINTCLVKEEEDQSMSPGKVHPS